MLLARLELPREEIVVPVELRTLLLHLLLLEPEFLLLDRLRVVVLLLLGGRELPSEGVVAEQVVLAAEAVVGVLLRLLGALAVARSPRLGELVHHPPDVERLDDDGRLPVHAAGSLHSHAELRLRAIYRIAVLVHLDRGDYALQSALLAKPGHRCVCVGHGAAFVLGAEADYAVEVAVLGLLHFAAASPQLVERARGGVRRGEVVLGLEPVPLLQQPLVVHGLGRREPVRVLVGLLDCVVP